MTGLILCRRWKSASLGNPVEKEKCRVKEVRLGRGNLLSPSTLTRVYLCLGKPDTWAMQSFAGSQATITLDDDDDDSQDEKDLQECPVCFQKFPTKEIEKHARKCLDKWVQRIPYWFGWVNCRRRRENCLTNRQILLSQFTCHALKRQPSTRVMGWAAKMIVALTDSDSQWSKGIFSLLTITLQRKTSAKRGIGTPASPG